jgi:phosphopantetheinyl transferase
MWTRKEALAKATGEGIGGIFRRGESRGSALQDRWTVMELSDLPGYAACVVAEGIGFRLVRRAR